MSINDTIQMLQELEQFSLVDEIQQVIRGEAGYRKCLDEIMTSDEAITAVDNNMETQEDNPVDSIFRKRDRLLEKGQLPIIL